MSNFTKKELRHLYYCIEQFKFSCRNEEFENEMNALRIKVESMIDSFIDKEKSKDSNFDDVSQIYSVNFELCSQVILGRIECFEAESKSTRQFKAKKPYKTLSEAIDAAIEALNKLKEPA